MSWTDSKSVKVIKYLRDKFKVRTFIETGTYKGINLLCHKDNFERIIGCEKNPKYHSIAVKRTKKYDNIQIYNLESKYLVGWDKVYLPDGNYNILYLDAHFYIKGCKNNME